MADGQCEAAAIGRVESLMGECNTKTQSGAVANSGFASQRGFSLLEMIVAIAIMGLSLGVLYQSVGGSSRSVRTAEQYAYAVNIAESLLAEYAVVPDSGLELQGEVNELYRWQVSASQVPHELEPPPARLMNLHIRVSWGDENPRHYDLHTLVAGLTPDEP